MRPIALPLLLLAAPAAAGPEALRLEAAASFRRSWLGEAQDPSGPSEPVLQPPLRPAPLAHGPRAATVARVDLAAQLDRQRRVLARQLGSRPWDIGVAADAGLRSYFLAFTEPGSQATVLAPVGELDRLRGAGVDARLDASTVYNFKVSVNLLNPTRGSTLRLRPALGTHGPQHDVRTGALLDAVKARAAVFRAKGKEYWLHYGTDAKPDGSGFADTRSFLFIHESGLNSKAWPLAEARVPVAAAVSVDLEGTRLTLQRTAGGELLVGEVP